MHCLFYSWPSFQVGAQPIAAFEFELFEFIQVSFHLSFTAPLNLHHFGFLDVYFYSKLQTGRIYNVYNILETHVGIGNQDYTGLLDASDVHSINPHSVRIPIQRLSKYPCLNP